MIYWDPHKIFLFKNFVMLSLLMTLHYILGSTLFKNDLSFMLLQISEGGRNELSSKTKIFQSDGGDEFIKTDFTKYFETCGILH